MEITMSPDKQQIAIAEACGYAREVRIVPTWEFTDYNGGGEYVKKETVGYAKGGKWILPENLPDYLHSLDAMHEAEKVMTDDQKHHYLTHLRRIAATPSFEAGRFVAFATAAQRAEAFLRTLDLWKL